MMNSSRAIAVAIIAAILCQTNATGNTLTGINRVAYRSTEVTRGRETP